MIDIGAVHHGINGERDAEPRHLGGERLLACIRAFVSGNAVSRRSVAVLDRDLHMIKTGIRELAEALFSDSDRRCDEDGVKACPVRSLGDLDEIAPRARLAAREMHLVDAE